MPLANPPVLISKLAPRTRFYIFIRTCSALAPRSFSTLPPRTCSTWAIRPAAAPPLETRAKLRKACTPRQNLKPPSANGLFSYPYEQTRRNSFALISLPKIPGGRGSVDHSENKTCAQPRPYHRFARSLSSRSRTGVVVPSRKSLYEQPFWPAQRIIT